MRVYTSGDKEYKALECAASMLTLLSPRKWNYRVDNTYLDFGSGTEWTTIICDGKGGCGTYQALCPREHEAIISGNVAVITNTVQRILADKYCPDR